MSVKQLRARVQHKKKTEAEWYLDVYVSAGSAELRNDPFIPLDGELIIFAKDSDHANDRFKFGDGKTNVMELPFASAEGGSEGGMTEQQVKEYVETLLMVETW